MIASQGGDALVGKKGNLGNLGKKREERRQGIDLILKIREPHFFFSFEFARIILALGNI